MKKISLLLILLVCLSSCNPVEVDNNGTLLKKNLKIGVFLYRNDDHFIHSVKETIEETIKQNKDEWNDIEFDFFDGKNQNEIQINQIKDAIENGYDALAINIVERSSASNIINMAKQKDIPIVFFNRQPIDIDMARWERLYYVGLDGVQSGEMQGEIITDYWNNNPQMDKNGDGILQYVILQGQYNHQDTILRTKYSVETIKNSGIQVQELAKETANWQRAQADSIMADLINIYGDRIELVIANNDMMALGAKDAIRRKHKKIDIPIVGVDGTKPALEALKKGEIIGTILNDEKEQGRIIAKLSVLLAKDIDPVSEFENMESGTYYWVEYKKVVN